MALTLRNLQDHIEHTLGGELASELEVRAIVNEAGRHLVMMPDGGWNCFLRPSTTLTLVVSQSYVDLPTDLLRIVGYDATNSLVNSLELTTLQHLLELRTNQIEIAAWNFYGAVVWSGTAGSVSTPLRPRLELWPTPQSGSETLSIFYQAGWTALTSDTDVAQIPSELETTYLHLVRAFARGYEEEDEASLGMRLAEIEAAPYYQRAVAWDGTLQPDYGPMRGGKVQSMPQGYNRFLRTTIAGPS